MKRKTIKNTLLLGGLATLMLTFNADDLIYKPEVPGGQIYAKITENMIDIVQDRDLTKEETLESLTYLVNERPTITPTENQVYEEKLEKAEDKERIYNLIGLILGAGLVVGGAVMQMYDDSKRTTAYNINVNVTEVDKKV